MVDQGLFTLTFVRNLRAVVPSWLWLVRRPCDPFFSIVLVWLVYATNKQLFVVRFILCGFYWHICFGNE